MQSPPLDLVSHTHYYCGGNVTIAPTAAIASGVVLQALPGASIDIRAGVCLGAGVVIQAKSGALIVEREASLGTGVLIVGHGSIGQGACIGPTSTIINPTVGVHEVVPPNSLKGDASRGRVTDQCSRPQEATPSDSQRPPVTSSNGQPQDFQSPSTFRSESPQGFSGNGYQSFSNTPYEEPVKSTYQDPAHSGFGGAAIPPLSPRTTAPIEPKPVNIPDLNDSEISESPSKSSTSNTTDPSPSALAVNNGYVYGRDQVNGLLSALFPHRQPLNES